MTIKNNPVHDEIKALFEGAEKKTPRKRRRGTDDGLPYDTEFPEGCPVEPLGINGEMVYFLDQKRQLRAIAAEKLNQGTIRGLFGEQGDLKYHFFPRFGKPNEEGEQKVTGWRPEQAADVLYNEAARRGIIDVMDSVRGPGSWQDEEGQIVMHCGDTVYHGDSAMTPSRIGRYIYPAAPAKPHPIPSEGFKKLRLGGIEEAGQLLAMLQTWNWRRPDVDPVLLVGWIGAALVGGALPWRPLIWITGDKATGKSTLHHVLKGVFGPGGLVAATDATAAGLWQTVGHASLPIALDELEAEQDNRKAQNIIKLARHAASGGQTLRGSSNHQNASFTIRSCVLFSSILMPPMLGQDVSRMAVLDLEKLGDSPAPMMSNATLAGIGAVLRRRMLLEFHRLPGLIEQWKEALTRLGHGGRGADQFGTLLACYDVMLSDAEFSHETLAHLAPQLERASMKEFEGDISDTDRCISALMTQPLDVFRSGERRTVGSWVIQAAGRDKDKQGDGDMDEANRALGNVGLRVDKKKLSLPGGTKVMDFLLVANDHNGLAQLFRDSHWAKQSGTDGVWVQALRRVRGSVADQQRFNGLKKRCTALPLDEILGGLDDGQ